MDFHSHQQENSFHSLQQQGYEYCETTKNGSIVVARYDRTNGQNRMLYACSIEPSGKFEELVIGPRAHRPVINAATLIDVLSEAREKVPTALRDLRWTGFTRFEVLQKIQQRIEIEEEHGFDSFGSRIPITDLPHEVRIAVIEMSGIALIRALGFTEGDVVWTKTSADAKSQNITVQVHVHSHHPDNRLGPDRPSTLLYTFVIA